MTGVDRTRLPMLGPDPPCTVPVPHTRSLANGLRLWTVEHRGLPVVSLLLLLPVGSASDPPDRAGLASLTGALLDEGSGDRSTIEVHEALGRIGARFDVDVGVDATLVRMTTLARFTGCALALLAGMVIRPRFDAEAYGRVRDLRLDRLIQLRDLAPAVADRAFAHALYRDHPYGHLPIGTERAIRDLTRDDVVAFHRRAYGPSDATLIAVGDLTHDALLEGVTAAFAEWACDGASIHPVAAEPRPDPAPERASSDGRLIVFDRPGAAQSELRIGHVAAARCTPDYHALLVLNMVLGGQFVSRVNLNLREDKGYTYGARTTFECRRGRGPFVVRLGTETKTTAASIREVIREIRAIRDERPVSADELDVARAALTRGYPRSFETPDQIAGALAGIALYQLPDDECARFVPRVAAVDQAAVAEVARSHLDPDRLSTIVVGDREAILPALARLDLGVPQTIETP